MQYGYREFVYKGVKIKTWWEKPLYDYGGKGFYFSFSFVHPDWGGAERVQLGICSRTDTKHTKLALLRKGLKQARKEIDELYN